MSHQGKVSQPRCLARCETATSNANCSRIVPHGMEHRTASAHWRLALDILRGQPLHALGDLSKVAACLDVGVPVGRIDAANALELGDGAETKSRAASLHRVARKALGV